MLRAAAPLCLALMASLAWAPAPAPAAATGPSPAAPIEHDPAGEWPMAARDHANTRFSPLAQIMPDNVARLQPVLERATGAERVFFNTLDGQAIAVDAATGRELWRTKLGDLRRGETITMAPLVVRGKVLVGNFGGEYGVRGWLVALDAASGKELWRAYSTGPDKDVLIGPGFKPFYPQDRGPDLGERTWPGQAWKQGGGNVWGWVSYDPQLDLLYYGTANPGPWNPEQRPGKPVRDICPSSPGAKDWQPSAWSPRKRLLYIPHQNLCQDATTSSVSYIAGTPYVGADLKMKPGPGGHRGEVEAWDPAARKAVWTIKESFPVWSGALATAGDVVFYGTMDGWFKAVDARSGKELWKHKTPSGNIGQPVSFLGPDGRQFIAVLSGVGGWAGAIVSGNLDPRDSTAAKGFVNAMRDLPQATRKGGAIHVFALPK